MTHVIHYHQPEGKKPSPLIEAFLEAADAAALLPPHMPDQPDEDEDDDEDDDDYYDYEPDPDWDDYESANEGALIDRIMNGGDRY
jgi:hypothetical protein